MRLAVLVLAAVFLAAGASAQDWRALNGAEIEHALTSRSLQYDGARQDFKPSGKTLYDAGEASWGNWRVDDDKYCSQWPPNSDWVCYAVDIHRRGLDLRFVDGQGNFTVGRYNDLN